MNPEVFFPAWIQKTGARMIETVDIRNEKRLSDYADHAYLTAMVNDLRSQASALAWKLRGRSVWMVNSTANGGGVAEMLPKLISILRELGVRTEWAVVSPQEKDFFPLTKRIHNLIHDFGRPGFNSEDAVLYDKISQDMARGLSRLVAPHDILVIHDPQPLGAGAWLKRQIGMKAIWRCHIGLDKCTPASESAWNFLKAYADVYDRAVFSAQDYVPPFLAGKTSIISPAIDPLSPKNKDLTGQELIDILRRAGLVQNGHHPTAAPPWKRQAMRLQPGGAFTKAASGVDLGLMFRPIIAQISRWDRLKGWEYLLEGFLKLKRTYRVNGGRMSPRHRRMNALQLLLVGPDPAAVQDDPEGTGVLQDLCSAYQNLSTEEQQSVVLLTLPMASREQNHLMVNAIQRCASVVVQNSVQEGFGLTATEAMWKKAPVLGTSACGLRQQIRPGIDGRLTSNPTDSDEISANLDEMLSRPVNLKRWGLSAQRHVYERFLVFSQVEKWLRCLSEAIDNPVS